MKSTIDGTLKHVLFLARHLNKCDPKCVAVVMLLELGIPTKKVGFDYLKNAIVMCYNDPAQMITKGIYPAVGKLYAPEISSLQIEWAIRSAITEAWKVRNDSVWELYFPQDPAAVRQKPTNAEFISMAARFLELWHSCCEEVGDE